MSVLLKILRNRNTILVIALILGLTIGDYSKYLKDYTLIILAIVMTFSTTGISTKDVFPLKESLKIMLGATTLNYFIASTIVILLSWFIVDDKTLYYGLIVIAASPPGVAVIPFSFILKGDLKYAIIGSFGAYLAAIIITPFIISVFTGGIIAPYAIFLVMVKIIVVPLVISRFLLYKPIKPIVEKVRGRFIDWGFALIIFTAVGLNRQVFFSDFQVLFVVSLVLVIAIWGIGFLFQSGIVPRLKNKERAISQNLFLTVKSSGFTAATALALFGEKAAIPSAVMSVLILAYLLFLSIRTELKST
jgi:bile acid:Na+ symporter, BASS family